MAAHRTGAGPGLAALAFAWSGLVASGCSRPAEEDVPPDASADAPTSILFVSIDTLRADHVGLYGYERDTTPYLDRLADECLVFNRAYTTAPWTLVAHMSMMSGLEPTGHGVVNARRAVSPEVPLLAERLHDAGYRTLGFYYGKWLSAHFGFDRGFDVYREHGNAEEAGRHIADDLADQNVDRPLFLFVHLFDVHSASFAGGLRGFYDPPPPYDELFRPGARDLLADVPCEPVWRGEGALTGEQLEAMTALYDGGVRYADAWLAETIEGWRESGLLDRSLLILTADHGESLGQHGAYGDHGGMYEEGLRIPLLVRFPDGFRAGEREGGLVSVVDYVPTVLEAAGLEIEPWRVGRSLRRSPPPDRVVRAERSGLVTRIGAGWKLIQDGAHGTAFQLSEDAAELEPLGVSWERAPDAIRALLQREAQARASRVAPPGQAVRVGALDAAARAELGNLGYAAELDEE